RWACARRWPRQGEAGSAARCRSAPRCSRDAPGDPCARGSLLRENRLWYTRGRRPADRLEAASPLRPAPSVPETTPTTRPTRAHGLVQAQGCPPSRSRPGAPRRHGPLGGALQGAPRPLARLAGLPRAGVGRLRDVLRAARLALEDALRPERARGAHALD